MSSANDLDQGGTFREWVRTYLGPSVGWVMFQQASTLVVKTGGITKVDLSISLVQVNFNGAVTIQLPSSIVPPTSVPAITIQPSSLLPNITISDIGGFASINPITILPFGSELIFGLPSVQIIANFGGFSLKGIPTGGWSTP